MRTSYLDELGNVSEASSMQDLVGGCGRHAEQRILAQRSANAEQSIHAGLARHDLQDVDHVVEEHRQQELPLVCRFKALYGRVLMSWYRHDLTTGPGVPNLHKKPESDNAQYSMHACMLALWGHQGMHHTVQGPRSRSCLGLAGYTASRMISPGCESVSSRHVMQV